jgi:soluble lytic murein transglycosylase-like protein
MKSFKEREAFALTIIPLTFRNAGLPPELGMALARQESNFDPSATATNPKDLAMGGAFGWCQMTMDTAHALGHKDITPAQLHDPAINASLAAELCVANLKRLPAFSAPDLFAMYNSGRVFAKAPHITQNNYVPRCMKFMTDYAAQLAHTTTK